jgi:hypothetical protein
LETESYTVYLLKAREDFKKSLEIQKQQQTELMKGKMKKNKFFSFQ